MSIGVDGLTRPNRTCCFAITYTERCRRTRSLQAATFLLKPSSSSGPDPGGAQLVVSRWRVERSSINGGEVADDSQVRLTAASTASGCAPLCMTTLTRLAGRVATWSRGGKASAPNSLSLRRRAFQGARMESGGGKSGRGALVVLEGLDRSGKSSQCARLLSFLEGQGHRAEGWRFPDRGTSVGQMISAYLANESQLDDRTIHLLFSANRWEKRGLMESKLLSGTTLVVDRYSYSGVAFSAAKGLDIEWCKAPEVGLIAPDLVIYLDVQPEKAAERGGYGGERYERIEFQKKVADHYHSLRDPTWQIVDGSLPMETVEQQLRELATNCIQECNGKPLTSLAW